MNEASPPPAVPWSTPRIEEVPLDDHYRVLYQQALVDEPIAPWERDNPDGHEDGDGCCALLDFFLSSKLEATEDGDGVSVCIVKALSFAEWDAAYTSEEKNQFTLEELRTLAKDGDWTFEECQAAEWYTVDSSDELEKIGKDWNDPDFLAGAKWRRDQAKSARQGKQRKLPAPVILPPLMVPYVFPDPATIPPRAWLHGGHYLRKVVTSMAAPGGYGKTIPKHV